MKVELDDLVSFAEIAQRAGVTKQAVTNWRARFDDFPQPVKAWGADGRFAVFLWPQVEKWLSKEHSYTTTWTRVVRTGPHKK